jgi:uncharacterized protein (TIRG00374 family)
MKKRIFRTIVALLFTALFIYILLQLVSFDQITAIMARVNPLWLLPSLAVYFISYIIRMYRFKVLLPAGGLTSGELLAIVLKHAFFLKIIPFKGGEFSFIYLLNKKGGVDAGHAASVLTAARLIDFIAMILFFLATLPLVTLVTPVSTGFKAFSAGFAALCLVSVLFLHRITDVISRLLYHVLRPFKSRRLVRRILIIGFSSRRGASLIGYGRLFAAFAMSCLTWALLFACFWFLMVSMRIYVHPVYLFFVSSAAIVASTVPVTLGTFGTFESGWVMTAVMAGFSTGSAVTTGLYQNLMMLLFCFLFYVVTIIREIILKQLDKRVKESTCG